MNCIIQTSMCTHTWLRWQSDISESVLIWTCESVARRWTFSIDRFRLIACSIIDMLSFTLLPPSYARSSGKLFRRIARQRRADLSREACNRAYRTCICLAAQTTSAREESRHSLVVPPDSERRKERNKASSLRNRYQVLVISSACVKSRSQIVILIVSISQKDSINL